MFKRLMKLFTRKPTKAEREAKVLNDLATLSLIRIAMKGK